MLGAIVSASFQDVCKPDQIGVHVGVRIFQGITNPGLSRQIDDPLGIMLGKGRGDRLAVFEMDAQFRIAVVGKRSGEARFFQIDVVILIETVESENSRCAWCRFSLCCLRASRVGRRLGLLMADSSSLMGSKGRNRATL